MDNLGILRDNAGVWIDTLYPAHNRRKNENGPLAVIKPRVDQGYHSFGKWTRLKYDVSYSTSRVSFAAIQSRLKPTIQIVPDAVFLKSRYPDVGFATL
jgi:hypothetical protein